MHGCYFAAKFHTDGVRSKLAVALLGPVTLIATSACAGSGHSSPPAGGAANSSVAARSTVDRRLPPRCSFRSLTPRNPRRPRLLYTLILDAGIKGGYRLFLGRSREPQDARRLVHSQWLDSIGKLSPQGNRVAVTRYVSGRNYGTELCVIDLAAGKSRAVGLVSTETAGAMIGFDWAANGRALYYDVQRGPDKHPHDQLMKVDLADPGESHAVPGAVGIQEPAVSPDGKKIAGVAVTRNRQGDPNSESLVVFDISTGAISPPLVTDVKRARTDHPELSTPAWSPDGKWLAVVDHTAAKTYLRKDNRSSKIFVVRADRPRGGGPIVAASGHREFFLSGPAWRTRRELWFARNFSSFGSSDLDPPSRPADLYSVRLHGGRFTKPVNETATPRRDEQYPSFGGRPADL